MTQSHDNAAAQAPLSRLFLGLMPECDLEGMQQPGCHYSNLLALFPTLLGSVR